MPQSAVPPVRRRGGISAEPVSEEDATSYVKKVSLHLKCSFEIFLKILKISGCSKRLQNDGSPVQSNRQKCPVFAFR